MQLLRNLRISHKLALIVAVMGVPIAVLGYLYVGVLVAQTEAVREELAGHERLRRLRDVVTAVALHRAAAEDGNAGALAEAAARADAAIQKVDAADRSLQVDPRWVRFRTDWAQLAQQGGAGTDADGANRHAVLASNLNSLLARVGEDSKLLMDPDIDAHFLSSATLEALPAWLAELAELRGSARLAADAEPAQVDSYRQTMSVLLADLDRELRDIERGVDALGTRNPALSQSLSQPLERTRDALAALGDQVRARTEEAGPVLTAADAVRQAALSLYDAALAGLGAELSERLDRLERDRILQFLLVIFVLALAVLLVMYSNRVITGQIWEINRLVRQISIGDLAARARVTSQDELGRMTESLNAMLDDTLAKVQSSEERDRIQNSIQKLLEDISGVAEGDLTKEAEVTAEVTGAIADSFNYMIVELRGIIAQVQNTTLQVSVAASQIQESAERLAQGSEHQSAQIVDTSAAVEEMAGSIRQVSATALSAAKVAQNALENSRRGAEAVSKTVDGMNAIRGQVQETAKRIKRLGESSQEVGEIVELIGDIADRTSILALNASIQAAMAGDAGRGFAVVAQEVEGLAERATESTKRIAGLIRSIQDDMNAAVRAMEDTTREVVGGSTLANEAGDTLERIETVSGQLEQLIRSISEASTHQAAGSDSVASAMGEISQGTLQTADGARQAAGSIRDLAVLADELRKSVSRFKIPARA
ncbi:MAG: HAMP domain-containing protein [Acidobacteria bacterium]|nr:HAMP domain-containing protein [Acidobacteriota bacterium]